MLILQLANKQISMDKGVMVSKNINSFWFHWEHMRSAFFIFLDSAWSGSLRPTGHKMSKGGNRGQDQNDGKSPWAGSLRHVNPNAQKKKKQKKEDGKLSYISNQLFKKK
jgi:hypothetical protein